jgi:hypothetical protein
MRTTPALRILAAALLTGGTLAVTAAGSTAAAAPPTTTEGRGDGGHGGGPVWGTIISRTDLNLRQAPTTQSPVVGRVSPGSEHRVECKVRGQHVNGNPHWYWLVGAQAWASAAFVDTGGHRVPTCSDPCPEWKDDSWSNADWSDPDWNEPWSASASGSWSISGSWSWSVSGSAR